MFSFALSLVRCEKKEKRRRQRDKTERKADAREDRQTGKTQISL